MEAFASIISIWTYEPLLGALNYLWSYKDNKDKTLSFSISVCFGAFFIFFLLLVSPYDLLLLFTHLSVYLTVRRGPKREGGDPAERRVLPKNSQPCQRGGQADGELAGMRRTIHHCAQCYVALAPIVG